MSLLGIIGKVATVGANIVTGGTAGTVLRAASTVFGSSNGGSRDAAAKMAVLQQLADVPTGKPSLFPSALPTPDSVIVSGGGMTTPIGSVGRGEVKVYFPGSGAQQLGPDFSGTISGASSTAPVVCAAGSGYRLNKTGYFLKSGQYVPPGTRCVKSRRRNPLNPRALSRAMGRLSSAKKAAKALDRFEVKGRRCR